MKKNESSYPVVRNLDGVFVRAIRDGKPCNRCFTDLTVKEQQLFLDGLDEQGLQRTCLIMSKTLRMLGDCFDISRRGSNDAYDA